MSIKRRSLNVFCSCIALHRQIYTDANGLQNVEQRQ